MRDVLAVMSTAIFAMTMFAPMLFHYVNGAPLGVDQDLKGAIMIQWGGVMGYYYGTSKSSVSKDVTISSMVPKQ